ncbi:major facilitator superfamily domain-containing protein [Lipomyces kononenkoae]|uniref:Major facilitator superfamily domain-containing protein n=1 Tax=Lipomyces kononenkoae TaxID=34357 RepID=A0ACC3T8N1_LIPKO
MNDIVRHSFFGELVHFASGGRLFQFPEQRPGFKFPVEEVDPLPDATVAPAESEKEKRLSEDADSSKGTTRRPEDTEAGKDANLVDWYGPDDPENPQNWSTGRKIFVMAQLCLLTTSLYMGASIYTPGVEQLVEDFHVSVVVASIPLCVYVFGYGIGQMLFAPLSEVPALGRNWVYLPTMFIFVVLQVPTALAKNIGSLIVLRFIAGFFSSPALSNGGASMGDILGPAYVPYGIATWAGAAVCGPVIGPLLGGVFTQVKDWRWAFWCLLWISGAAFIVLLFGLPETFGPTILSRRARRLRKITGNENLTTKAALEFASVPTSTMIQDNLIRPFIISFLEPGVLMLNIYTGFMYAVLYTWFEAFPIVFSGIYHFNSIQSGLAFCGLLVGCLISCAIYLYLIKYKVIPWLMAGHRPEILFKLAFFASPILPVSLIFFGWSATASAHWIAPIIASGLFVLGGFIVFQVLFNYLGMSYPRYLASVFAGNGLFRSGVAGAFPLFARQLFVKLGPSKFPIGFGSTVLAGIAAILAVLPFFFYHAGHIMRARSKYAN